MPTDDYSRLLFDCALSTWNSWIVPYACVTHVHTSQWPLAYPMSPWLMIDWKSHFLNLSLSSSSTLNARDWVRSTSFSSSSSSLSLSLVSVWLSPLEHWNGGWRIGNFDRVLSWNSGIFLYAIAMDEMVTSFYQGNSMNKKIGQYQRRSTHILPFHKWRPVLRRWNTVT